MTTIVRHSREVREVRVESLGNEQPIHIVSYQLTGIVRAEPAPDLGAA